MCSSYLRGSLETCLWDGSSSGWLPALGSSRSGELGFESREGSLEAFEIAVCVTHLIFHSNWQCLSKRSIIFSSLKYAEFSQFGY